MPTKTYFEKLRDPRWQKKRLSIMQRDGFACVLCNDTENTLNVHHKVYINGRSPWEYDDSDLATLCEECHLVVKELNERIGRRLASASAHSAFSNLESLLGMDCWPDVCQMLTSIRADPKLAVSINSILNPP